MDYSYLHRKTLFVDRTIVSRRGKVREQSIQELEVSGSAVTSLTKVTPHKIRSCTYEKWFVDKFEENKSGHSFDIRGKSFIPDYTVTLTSEYGRLTDSEVGMQSHERE